GEGHGLRDAGTRGRRAAGAGGRRARRVANRPPARRERGSSTPEEEVMRVPVIALAGLAAIAAALPGSAPAAAPGVRLVGDGPVTCSAPTARCPVGIATATVTVLGTGEQAVSTGCAKKAVPCGNGCTRFRISYDIPLAGGLIRDTVQQRQVSAPDRLVTGVT